MLFFLCFAPEMDRRAEQGKNLVEKTRLRGGVTPETPPSPPKENSQKQFKKASDEFRGFFFIQ